MHDVGAYPQIAALLAEPLLEPLEKALGPYGELATQSFSLAIADAMEKQRD